MEEAACDLCLNRRGIIHHRVLIVINAAPYIHPLGFTFALA